MHCNALILLIQIFHVSAHNYNILISIIPLLETFPKRKMEASNERNPHVKESIDFTLCGSMKWRYKIGVRAMGVEAKGDVSRVA
jgi:hypothetical protein